MLVQVRQDALRLIRQSDHALASGRMALAWVPNVPFPIAWGIALHDFAWADEDREPVWDSTTKSPVTFQTIDAARRALVYASGIGLLITLDEVAATLASLHYARFVPDLASKRETAPAAARSLELRSAAALLRHLDDLSLYVCLACPESESRPDWLTEERVSARPDGAAPHALRWIARDTLSVRPFPFERPLTLFIPCRDIPRRLYETADELGEAWATATPGEHRIRLVP